MFLAEWFLKRWWWKSLNLTKVVFCFTYEFLVSVNQLNELKTLALSKFVVEVYVFRVISNHMIFLIQFGINKHLQIFQRPQSELALRAYALLLVFENLLVLMYRSNRSFNMPPPPRHTPGIWHLCRPGEEGIWLSESSRGWGIWTAPSISCKIFGVASYHGGRGVRGFSW